MLKVSAGYSMNARSEVNIIRRLRKLADLFSQYRQPDEIVVILFTSSAVLSGAFSKNVDQGLRADRRLSRVVRSASALGFGLAGLGVAFRERFWRVFGEHVVSCGFSD